MAGQIRAGGIYLRVGGNCLKYLKRGWNRAEGRGHKDFQKGKLGQGVGVLKQGGAGTPLRTMIMQRFVQNLCNPGIFRTVACSEPEEYLESCQTSMIQHFFEPRLHPEIFRTLVYAEPVE